MLKMFKASARKFLQSRGRTLVQANVAMFRSDTYTRHNSRRLEHLASLGINVTGLTVLEVGAGIGDLSHYYIDRGCPIVITEGRPENLEYLRHRYRGYDVQALDLEHPSIPSGAPFDIVHCYGVLYHVADPAAALSFLSRCCKQIMLLETRLSEGEGSMLIPENRRSPVDALSGTGCRPTREWVFDQLNQHFNYIYVPKTQPNHEEFPIDWTSSQVHPENTAKRAIFVASREEIDSDMLSPTLIDKQSRHP